jgi:ribonuclease BN (tRNA processing enzyme)
MRLTVLGCSGTYPGPDSPCSGYLVEQDGFRLVVDLGPGALGPLQRSIDLREIDAVYVSHLHADHCTDLVGLSYALRYHPDGAHAPLPVWGPAGLRDRLCQVFEVPPPDRLATVFAFSEVPVGTQVIGPFTVTALRMNHPVECHGLRIEAGGRTLAYSADTAVTRRLERLAADADAFLCEASWPDAPDRPQGLHLSGRQAGEAAAAARARRLLLTHLMPWSDREAMAAEAAQAYDGPVEVVRSGAVYEV